LVHLAGLLARRIGGVWGELILLRYLLVVCWLILVILIGVAIHDVDDPP
jgi:hypothetical protein